jgi:mannose-6-phosphate isomerase-like protein (cupin superfamily)
MYSLKKGEIQRISAKDLSFEEFRKHYEEAGVPVIITDLLTASDLEKWKEDNLRAEIGDRPIVVDTFRNSSYHTLGSDYCVTKMTAGEFFDKLSKQNADPFRRVEDQKDSVSSLDESNNTKYFLNEATLLENKMTPAKNSIGASWAKLVGEPKYFDKNRHDITMAFMGHGSRATLHYHTMTQAMLYQITGTKTFILYEPDQSPLRIVDYYHQTNIKKKTVQRLGEVKDERKLGVSYLHGLRRFEVLLQPGDCIFIPIYWWHETYGNNRSSSFTHFWLATKKQLWSYPLIHIIDTFFWVLRIINHLFGLNMFPVGKASDKRNG